MEEVTRAQTASQSGHLPLNPVFNAEEQNESLLPLGVTSTKATQLENADN